jgi:hypothetical protein
MMFRSSLRTLSYRTLLTLSALILLPAIAFADTLTVTTDKTSYAPGQAMKITAVYKQDNGTPITSPKSREVRIEDPAGRQVVKTRMNNTGNGIYTYSYNLPSTARVGKWEVRAKFEYTGDEFKAYTYPTVATATADTTPPITSASPAGGTYTSPQSVTLTRNETGTTYYTVNGVTPTTSSAVYSAPIAISATTTLKYFSRDAAGNSETIKTQIYTITAADTTPPVTTASPLGGSFATSVTVSLSRNETGTTYYTVNGTTPTTASAVYTSALTFTDTTTLKYFSRDTAGNSEAVKTQTYTKTAPADTTAPVTSASPAGGSYTTAQSVTLSANETATIYYTVNGATPTTASAVYSTPIAIAATTTLKYFARDTAGNAEAVKTQTYTISAPTATDHSNLTWTGYGTCTTCHSAQAQAMYQSVHYQWKGSAAEMTTGPTVQGKMDAIDGSSALNAYCINIQGNWGPCGSCHVGTGAKPVATASPSAAQLAAIDCLMCHNNSATAPYSRVRNATTGLFEPAAGLDMTQVARSANVMPSRKNCLGCHAKAGGGDAVKRGDIALASGTTADDLYDVHMATDRGNLSCQSCHTMNNHRVAGRGSDLRPEDTTAEVSCSTSSCHSGKSTTSGHSTSAVNKHIGRVACQTCHIPKYAKNANDTAATEATETHRTWEHAEWNAALNRYEPMPTKANDLRPKYAFWNGTSWGNNAFDTAVIDPATGNYKISRPNGGINTANTKLYPFKYKTATQAVANGKLITLSTATFFGTGNYDQAVKDGLTYMGLPSTTPYTTVTTDELQVLNHQVPPSTGNVLTCTQCHPQTTTTVMKLKDMGYALKGTTSVVCTQCHGNEDMPSFTSIHDKHVTSLKYDCSFCHTFSRAAERGLKTTR